MGIFAGLNTSTQFDPDAGAFINVTGIGGIQAEAINNLVQQLKAAGLWSQMRAIYPMVGGTAQSCKFNLVNPQDTDAAFRLTFAGTWTFDNNGAKPNGASGTYAETYATQTAAGMSTTNGHISYYSFTNSAAASEVEIGNGSSGQETNLAANFDGNFYVFYASAGGGTANTNSSGFYINNRAASTEGWRNGTRLINTGNGASNSTNTFRLAMQNDGTTSYRNSKRGCAFASIGLTLGSATNFTNIVNNFCRTLQRNTF
jgi:hypothetical protein